MTCLPLPGGSVCVPTLIHEVRRRRTFWCFGCRRFLLHKPWLTDDLWYDPERLWLCTGCGRDRREFPG